jgi:hypothetical protein
MRKIREFMSKPFDAGDLALAMALAFFMLLFMVWRLGA